MIETLDVFIWGREFLLPIVYDCLSDGVINEGQTKAVDRLIKHPEWIEMSKICVENYCRDSVMEDDKNLKKDNIFSYIKPQRLFVKRSKKNPNIAIMCNYRYDPEHGLAIVFSHDGQVTVGIQDIIL